MGGCWRNEELGEIVETILGMLGDDIAKAKVLSDLLVTELSLLRRRQRQRQQQQQSQIYLGFYWSHIRFDIVHLMALL